MGDVARAFVAKIESVLESAGISFKTKHVPFHDNLRLHLSDARSMGTKWAFFAERRHESLGNISIQCFNADGTAIGKDEMNND